MKRLFTIAVLVIIIQVANAHAGISILNIRLNDNSPFRLYVDGREAAHPGRTAQLNNLQPGKHFIEIFRTGKNRGHHSSYPVFRGSIVLAANTESFVTVLPEYNTVNFDRIVAINNGWSNDHNDPCLYPKPPMVGPSNCGTPSTPVVNYGPIPMNQMDFAQLKETINNAGFENTRLTILKQALAYNHFSTQQVRELMNLFWFESSKLEVAKIAYAKTVDQQNYYLVNNNFSFSSSVNQLTDYIAMQ
jgi:hypothetical protein